MITINIDYPDFKGTLPLLTTTNYVENQANQNYLFYNLILFVLFYNCCFTIERFFQNI